MGTFCVTVEIGDPSGANYREMSALVGMGASHTAIPASVLRELGVTPHTRATFRLADGREIELEMGRIWVRMDGREQMTLVVFGGEDTALILGAVTLEEFRLGVGPIAQRLIPVPGLLMSSTHAL